MVSANNKFRVPAVPNMPVPIPKNANFGIRVATPDLILLDQEPLSPDIMADLIFESIGGQELISIVRNDTVSGQNVIYQPIKNLARIRQLYNPLNIIGLRVTSESIFKNFPIKLESYIPGEGGGPNKETVYLDDATGDIVVEVINAQREDEVEIQVLRSGTILNDTIYSNVILGDGGQA
jgi:hypothetical protein